MNGEEYWRGINPLAIFGVEKSEDPSNCGMCYKCLADAKTSTGLPVTISFMIVCQECGNKRCPKSTDHELICTGSNDAGQPGSRYGV